MEHPGRSARHVTLSPSMTAKRSKLLTAIDTILYGRRESIIPELADISSEVEASPESSRRRHHKGHKSVVRDECGGNMAISQSKEQVIDSLELLHIVVVVNVCKITVLPLIIVIHIISIQII